jgi:hypothetical protein
MEESGIEKQLAGRLVPSQLPGAFDSEDGNAAAVEDIIDTDQVHGTGDEQHDLPHVDLYGHQLPFAERVFPCYPCE